MAAYRPYSFASAPFHRSASWLFIFFALFMLPPLLAQEETERVSQVDPVALILRPLNRPEASGGVEFLEKSLRRAMVARRYALISASEAEKIKVPEEPANLPEILKEANADLVIWSRLVLCRVKRRQVSPASLMAFTEELEWTKFLMDPSSIGGGIDCTLSAQIKVYSALNEATVETSATVHHQVRFLGSLQSRRSAIAMGMDKLVVKLFEDVFEKRR